MLRANDLFGHSTHSLRRTDKSRYRNNAGIYEEFTYLSDAANILAAIFGAKA